MYFKGGGVYNRLGLLIKLVVKREGYQVWYVSCYLGVFCGLVLMEFQDVINELLKIIFFKILGRYWGVRLFDFGLFLVDCNIIKMRDIFFILVKIDLVLLYSFGSQDFRLLSSIDFLKIVIYQQYRRLQKKEDFRVVVGFYLREEERFREIQISFVTVSLFVFVCLCR